MSQPLSHFLLLLFLSFFFKTSYANNSTCSTFCPTKCCNSSSVPIRYPFSLVNSSLDYYCGHAGFRLNCSNGQPVITLPNQDQFYVRDINYDDQTITLVDIDVVDQTCPRVQYNLSLGDLPLTYSKSSDLLLSFYFNCSSPLSDVSSSSLISCFEPGSNLSYVLSGNWSDKVDWYGKCETCVVVAVKRSEVVSNDDGSSLVSDFGNALNEGFVLDWGSDKACGECEDSNGCCGYNTSTGHFLCFCPDGSIQNRTCGGHGMKQRDKIIIGVSTGLGFVAITCLIFFVYLWNKKRKYPHSSFVARNVRAHISSKSDIEKGSKYFGAQIFTYAELEEATNNFDTKQELGDGGFGTVYYGELLDGRAVAVKRLYENNYRRIEQFMNEVEILTRLRHPNLVTLYGCTSRHSRELLLVYEYISNGTVADHIHGEKAKPGSLPWSTRLNIAVETASALVYLHKSAIIHRDVKTNNILLDNNFQVKVADFGLSRLFPLDATHISTAPQGTPGYVDPDYHQCYQLTDKSDVYSFGVVLIELLSSLPAVDITRHRHEINLSNMAISKIQSNALHELVDKSLGFESNHTVRKTVSAVAELAFQCLQSTKETRPAMEVVLENLEEIQSTEHNLDKVEDKDMVSDDKGLLKLGSEPLSPVSVTFKWTSNTTTPSTSS